MTSSGMPRNDSVKKKVAKGKAPRNSDVARIAEDRFLEIERRLTELLVLRHELEVFLREMSGQLPAEDGARELYRRLLIPGDDAQIGVALQQIAASEAGCAAHTEPRVESTEEGYVFSAHGDTAFLFAQFFLALEHRTTA